MTVSREEKNHRAKRITEILKELYPDPKPLLHYRNAFELLVATILAAQCTDERVNQVTPDLFQAYPTAEKMSQAPVAQLEKLIRSTGFYHNKAKNLKKLATILHESYKQGLPETIDELIKLPGVGRKTANVMTSHLFHKPSIIVDTHFKRVAGRLGFTREKDPAKTEKEVKSFLDMELWSSFSSLINYHGRYICKARKPLCLQCPLTGLCPFPDKTG